MWDRRAPFRRFAYANGALGLFYLRRIDGVDGCGVGAFFEVAEAVLDALEAEEGDDADDAVGQDAETEEDAEEDTSPLRVAEGQETQDDAAQAKQEHEPPAVIAPFLIVEGEDGEGDPFEQDPHGEDSNKGHFGCEDVGGQHEAYDDLEHRQQCGGACIGQEGLSPQAEDEREDTRGDDEQPHKPCGRGETGTRMDDANHTECDEQHGGDDEIGVDSFHGG